MPGISTVTLPPVNNGTDIPSPVCHISGSRKRKRSSGECSNLPSISSNHDETPSKNAADITFGVELEFFAIYDPAKFHERFRDCRQPQKHIFCGFISKGMQAVHEAIKTHAPDVPLYSLEKSLTDPDGERDYEKWQVATDGSVQLSEEEENIRRGGFVVDAIELISRVFSVNEDWEKELKEITSALHNAYPSDEYKLLVNDSAGLHVHVGENSTGIGLNVAQKISKLTTGFERCFDMLHAANRINTDRGKYCKGPVAIIKESKERRERRDRNIAKDKTGGHHNDLNRELGFQNPISPTGLALCLDQIERQRNLLEFADLVSGLGGKASAINFHPLLHAKTVEFRQHRGSLNFEEITAWIKVVTRVVEVAYNQSENELNGLIESRLLDCSFHPTKLLKELALDGATQKYYANKIKRRGRCFEKKWMEETLSTTCKALQGLVKCIEMQRFHDNTPREVANQILKKSTAEAYGLPADNKQGGYPFWNAILDKHKKNIFPK